MPHNHEQLGKKEHLSDKEGETEEELLCSGAENAWEYEPTPLLPSSILDIRGKLWRKIYNFILNLGFIYMLHWQQHMKRTLNRIHVVVSLVLLFRTGELAQQLWTGVSFLEDPGQSSHNHCSCRESSTFGLHWPLNSHAHTHTHD